MSSLLIALILVGFGAPWAWLLYRRSREHSLEAVFDCICLGYAISFVLLYVSAQVRLWLFLPLWAAGVIACAVDALRRRREPREPFLLGVEGKIVLGTGAFYLALRCLPFVVRRMPLGWDAYFHMTISESIVARGRAVADWLPYEDIPLNYPIGAHLLLSLSQWLTGARPHLFFELFVVVFTLLTGLQIFSLAARATKDRTVGCYSALVYLFLANYGSLHYAIWSGLPNLIGMYLFLGLLTTLLIEPRSSKVATAVFATFFLGACFVHHHVMVTAGLCLGWTALYAYTTGERALAKRILTGLVAAGVLGLPYFGSYLLRTVGLANTGIEAYMEDRADAWMMASDLGFGFTLVVLTGLYLYFKNAERVSLVAMQPLIAMLVLYVLIEFGVRTYSAMLFRHEISPFTPSRFLTDAVTLLSIFGGILFRTMQGERPRARAAIVGMIVAGFFVFNRTVYRDTFEHELPRSRRTVYDWIRENTAADAVLLDNDLHATYLTRRMSSSFPLPTSEYGALAENRKLLEDVLAGAQPASRTGRQVLAVVEPDAKAPPGKLLFSHRSGLRVVETFAPVQTASH